MIRLGLNNTEKAELVKAYCEEHEVKKVYILSPARFAYCKDFIDYPDIITYKIFYKLMQEIDKSSLVVVNECLRTQNRHDLTYNCIRNYMNQTGHQIIFQYLPIIDTFDDFMTLVDWDTQSKWKREKFRPEMLSGVDIQMINRKPVLKEVGVETDDKIKTLYAAKKRSLIDKIGLGDPHTIPRNLLLMSGKAKCQHINSRPCVGRNNRFGLPDFHIYKDETSYPDNCLVFEFCHNFIDFSSFLTVSRQVELGCLVTDLKVDKWYFDRYVQWTERIENAYTEIRR